MNETVLVVDDKPTNLQVLVGFLAAGGYSVRVAQDGATALEQVQGGPPDLILLDVTMPEMDGFEVCRRLKQDQETKDIPVVFITARSEIADKLKGFQAGGVDYITKPIQKEEVIARVNTHLALRRQKRQLETLLEQRQRFMRIAAHDLRNLLAVVLGFSDLALNCQEKQSQHQALLRVRGASQRMKALIDDFLALQRPTDSLLETFDLRPILEQVCEQASLAAAAKQIALGLETPPGPLSAFGSPGHTHQVLSNYTSNALKYSPAGTRTRISALSEDGAWRIEVHDQGPGIPADERPKLFVEFPKISNRPTGGEDSTGLGLFIVKTLAEAQGGSVGARFPGDGGSVFWLEVPRPPVPAPSAHLPSFT
jgi:two-component system, sensor histidine kinase and response regulator